MVKLSIITCTYNSEKYLSDCIESIKKQNLDKDIFEHIFVDWKSSDKTKEIIGKYKKETWFNIFFYEQKPKWVYSAMNYWAEKSSWEYLMWLNSDDFLEVNILAKYLNFIENTWKKDLYYGILRDYENWKITVADKYIWIKKILFKYFWSNVLINHPTVLMRRDTFFELWKFDESNKFASDIEMWLYAEKYNKSMKFFPYEVTNFRIHSESLTSSKKHETEMKAEHLKIVKKVLPKWKIWLHYLMIKLVRFYVKKLK